MFIKFELINKQEQLILIEKLEVSTEQEYKYIYVYIFIHFYSFIIFLYSFILIYYCTHKYSKFPLGPHYDYNGKGNGF